MIGVYDWFTTFDTTIGIMEPNYEDVCLFLCMLVFKKNCVFYLWDVMYLFLMNGIVNDDIVVVWDLCCLKTWGMWILGMKFICIYVECDYWWYWWHWDKMMLMLMIILIWDDVDVDVYDNIDMRWCWWWYRYEMMLMLMLSLWYVHWGWNKHVGYP